MIPTTILLPDGTVVTLTPLQRLRLAIVERNRPRPDGATPYAVAMRDIAAGKLVTTPVRRPV